MEKKTDEQLADEKIKEMFPLGYCVGGNYEGYKRTILEGIKIGKKNCGHGLSISINPDSFPDV